MNTHNSSSKTERITITVPAETIKKIKHFTKGNSISGFFAIAATEKITREEKNLAFQSLLSAPPTFTDIPDVSDYLQKIRKSDIKRESRTSI